MTTYMIHDCFSTESNQICCTCMYMYIRVSFGGGGGAGAGGCIRPPPLAIVLAPLEFVCQYAHYDNPVCRPLKVFQIHVLRPPP